MRMAVPLVVLLVASRAVPMAAHEVEHSEAPLGAPMGVAGVELTGVVMVGSTEVGTGVLQVVQPAEGAQEMAVEVDPAAAAMVAAATAAAATAAAATV